MFENSIMLGGADRPNKRPPVVSLGQSFLLRPV